MSHAIISADESRLTPARLDLRGRIGWLCQALRITAVIWLAWMLVRIVLFWGDKAVVLQLYERLLATDLTGFSTTRYGFVIALVLIDWSFSAIVVACVWRLFGTYLAGRVFTVDAAVWLRRAGVAGITAVLFSVLARVAIVSILADQLTFNLPRGLLLPQDLLNLMFAGFALALAYIFKAAAELAEDHAQIV